MIGLEVDRFVQDNARHCDRCKLFCFSLSHASQDLRAVIRVANRRAEPTPKVRQMVADRKADLAKVRGNVEEHIREEHS